MSSHELCISFKYRILSSINWTNDLFFSYLYHIYLYSYICLTVLANTSALYQVMVERVGTLSLCLLPVSSRLSPWALSFVFCFCWCDHPIYALKFTYMVYYIYWFAYVDSILHFWGECHNVWSSELGSWISLVSILLRIFASVLIREIGL